jgi:hypothetical protein
MDAYSSRPTVGTSFSFTLPNLLLFCKSPAGCWLLCCAQGHTFCGVGKMALWLAGPGHSALSFAADVPASADHELDRSYDLHGIIFAKHVYWAFPARRCLFLQTYFYQAVILLLDHGPDGSYGIILNRPTQYKVSQIKSTVHELLSLFSDNRLFMGGDCGDTAMVVLTHRADIDGVTQVRETAALTHQQQCCVHA